MPSSLRLCLLTVLLCLVPVAAADAAPVLEPWAGPITRTDGVATAVTSRWEERTLSVLDDAQEPAAARALPLPEGCGGAVPRGTVVALQCGDTLRLSDLAAGTVTDVPSAGVTALREDHSGSAATVFLETLGTAWAQLSVSSNKYEHPAYADLRTGRVTERLRTTTREVVDLDSPSGTSRLCAPLKVPTRPTRTFRGKRYRARAAAVFRAPYLVTVLAGRVALRRCGKATALRLGDATTTPVLTRRYAAWASPRRLTVRIHATGQRLVFPLAVPESGVGVPRLAGTERRLWLSYGEQPRVLDLGRPAR